MASYMYHIVEFLEGEEVAVISANWLGEDDNGETVCWWPSANNPSRINQQCRSHKDPDENWKTYRIELQQDGTAGMIALYIVEILGIVLSVF